MNGTALTRISFNNARVSHEGGAETKLFHPAFSPDFDNDTQPHTLPDALIPMENTQPSPAQPVAGLIPLTFEQARVLGCLIEKESTTPDSYPLTLNAAVTACNQSTNRDPVVTFSEQTVLEALEGLKTRHFVFQVTLSGARVQKYKHNLERKMPWLEKPEIALLCVLLLRGAQTLGELRQRTERLYNFPDLAALEETLQKMISGDGNEPTAVLFPPGPGRKSPLYLHTLCGVPESPALSTPAMTVNYEPNAAMREDDNLWRARMEADLAALREELRVLKEKLGES